MKPQTRRRFLAFMVVILVIAASAYLASQFSLNRQDSIAESPPFEEAASEHAGDEEEAEVVVGVSPQESMEPAQRIVHVPDTQKDSDNQPVDWTSISVTDENLPRQARRVLDAALTEDVEAAVTLRSLRDRCRNVPSNEIEFDNHLAAVKQMTDSLMEAGVDLSQGRFPSRIFGLNLYSDEDQYRSELLARYIACKELRGIFSPDFRKQLYGKALQGEVMARYIYATWEPDSFSVEWDFESDLEWQINAFEFSYANLEEGEAVGLLAFGQSYLFGLFTRLDSLVAFGFIKASLDCGLETSWASTIAGDLTEQKGSFPSYLGSGAGTEKVVGFSTQVSQYCK